MVTQTSEVESGPASVQVERRVPLGPGVTEDRIIVPWAEYLELKRADANLVRYAVAYLTPGAKGPGTGPQKAMACEKHLKWWGQGYRPVGYVQLQAVPPKQWLPSMIEDAIALGQPIPEEMRPPGYSGLTFPLVRANRARDLPEPLVAEPQNGGEPEVTVYYCEAAGCTRFFDLPRALAMHREKGHKG